MNVRLPRISEISLQLGAQLLPIAIFALVARKMETTEFGELSTAQIYFSLLLLVGSFGFPNLLPQVLTAAGSKRQQTAIIRRVLTVQTCLTFLVWLLLVCLQYLNVIARLGVAANLILLINSAMSTASLWPVLRSLGRYKQSTVCIVVCLALQALSVMPLLRIANSMELAMLAHTTGLLFSTLLSVYFAREWLTTDGAEGMESAPPLLKSAAQMTLANGVATLPSTLCPMVLANVGGPLAIATYSVAARVANGQMALQAPMMLMYAPALCSLYRSNRDQYMKVFVRTTLMLLGVALTVLIGAHFVPELPIRILAGEGFPDAAGPLRLLIAANLFSTLSACLSTFVLIPRGRTIAILLANIVGAVVAVTCTHLLDLSRPNNVGLTILFAEMAKLLCMVPQAAAGWKRSLLV